MERSMKKNNFPHRLVEESGGKNHGVWSAVGSVHVGSKAAVLVTADRPMQYATSMWSEPTLSSDDQLVASCPL